MTYWIVHKSRAKVYSQMQVYGEKIQPVYFDEQMSTL